MIIVVRAEVLPEKLSSSLSFPLEVDFQTSVCKVDPHWSVVPYT